MPILSAITAISKRYPDIAVDPDKDSFEKKLSILTGIFFLVASRSDNLCYDKIVIASEARRSQDDSPKARDCHVASLLATTSASLQDICGGGPQLHELTPRIRRHIF